MNKFFCAAVAVLLVGACFLEAGPFGLFGSRGSGSSCANGSCASNAVAVSYRTVVPPQAPAVAWEQPPQAEPLPPPTSGQGGVRVTAPGVNVEVAPRPARQAVPVGTVWAVPAAGYSRTVVTTETGDVGVAVVGKGRVRGFFKQLFHRGG